MVQTPAQSLTLEEFLQLPETEPDCVHSDWLGQEDQQEVVAAVIGFLSFGKSLFHDPGTGPHLRPINTIDDLKAAYQDLVKQATHEYWNDPEVNLSAFRALDEENKKVLQVVQKVKARYGQE